MKKLIFFLLLIPAFAFSQTADTTPIEVNLSDNARLQWGGSAVKQKCIVLDYRPIINANKDFYIRVRIQYYANNAGTYGGKITDLINADATLSTDQRAQLLQIYNDRIFEWQSTDVCVDVNGDVTACPGAMTENAYWQQFKLSQVSGIGSLSTQGAFDAEYKIIRALVTKMNSRKNW